MIKGLLTEDDVQCDPCDPQQN